MASSLELEAQDTEFEALLIAEGRPAARLGGGTRAFGPVAAALGAAVLLALGGKAAWHGVAISERDVVGASGACTENGQSCSESLCCTDWASKCFRKNSNWSSCNATCDPNMLWVTDGWARQNETVWACEPLSPAENGENCMYSKECVDGDSRCYKKNDHWASCNKTCSSNMLWVTDGWVAQDDKVWDCHVLSAANDGENCMESKACSNPNSQCFKKNEKWASCNATCSADYLWENNSWVEKPNEQIWDCKVLSCTADGDNCMDSRCCKSEGSTCFKKDEHWASCNATCSPNNLWTANGWTWTEGTKVWDCEELLPLPEDKSETCDTTGCDGCGGEQCQYCREGKERDCCLDQACKWASGEQVAKCKEDNLKTCCEGKTEHCLTTDAPTDAPTDGTMDATTDAPTDGSTDAPTDGPTDAPTDAPTDGPTDAPTDAPTNGPTDEPTDGPTDAPTDAPSS